MYEDYDAHTIAKPNGTKELKSSVSCEFNYLLYKYHGNRSNLVGFTRHGSKPRFNS